MMNNLFFSIFTKPRALVISTIFALLALLFVACDSGSNAPTSQQATPTAVPVNGFGTNANHVHALLAMADHTLILATHYGIYHSNDSGQSWQQVSGGNNQLMQGLMEYSLSSSSLDPQRIYVLTQPSVFPHAGTLGLYTSADQGKTWQLAIPSSKLTTGNPYFVAAGNSTPQQVYVYLPDQGAQGLKVSQDAGQHFSDTGALPFGRILGMLAIPGEPGHLLAYGNDGVARSSDGGAHWQVLKSTSGAVFEMATSGPHRPICASGDAGIYVSNDSGNSFTLINTQASYASLSVSPVQKQVLYGKTGTTVYRSADGGHSWQALPHINGNLSNLAVDPTSATQVYLAISYPTEVYRFDQNSGTWSSLTPKA